MSEQLNGTIERVTFHSPETGYAVLRVLTRARRGVVTVVGSIPSVTAGEHLTAKGSWVHDPQHGEQFKAEEIVCSPPSSVAGIEKYLASGLVKGIGPKYARKIVEVFGERTLQVIDESPSFLKEIKGIGPQRIAQIRESWRQQKAVRDIMVFLQTHGLGTQRAVRIYKTYGDDAVQIVRENPYRLATDIWGVGFKTADELGARLGIDPASPQRARAALRYVLQKLSQEGNVGYPEDEVIQATLQIPDLPDKVVRDAVDLLRQEDEVVREPGHPSWLYLKPLFLAELGIARNLAKLQEGPHPLPSRDAEATLARIEQKMGLELAPGQRDALRQATRQKVLVLTGGPGTGKTTIVRGLIELFTAHGMRVHLCAPTGRAAKRLNETTGREAKTIHRLLEYEAMGGFRRTAAHPLDCDLLVVDESSMVDVPLMHQLVRAIPGRACVVFVGDTDQLPSVGPGTALADLIASGVVGVARLTEIFRQAGESWIVRAAHAIRAGRLPESAPAGGGGDFYFIEADSPPKIVGHILTMVRERIPTRFGLDPLRDVQVLTPMNRSDLGTQALNQRLQQTLNPPAANKAEIQRFGWCFRVGDKVMQTQNNYDKEVFNGDMGRVARIDDGERELTVDYEGREVRYDYGELDEITLSWSISIHKCVAGYGYTAIQGKGLVRVSEVSAGQRIQTGQSGYQPVLNHVATGEKPIVRLRTRWGYAIDVSQEHPLFVASKEQYPHFARAMDLQPGTYVCINREVVEGSVIPLPSLVYQTQKSEKRLTVPATLDPDLAWALGVLVGDGSYRDTKNGMVDLINQDKDILDRYRAVWEPFGLHLSTCQKSNCMRTYFCSIPLRRWLHQLGLGFDLADQKRAPALLWNARAEVRGAFLRGLFDTDGSVGVQNVRYTTASPALANEVHTLLLSLGIVSRVHRQGPRHHKVCVSSTALPLYRERIGFVSQRKLLALDHLLTRSRPGKTNLDIIPFGQMLAQEYAKGVPKAQGIKGQGRRANRDPRFLIVSAICRGQYRLTYAHLRMFAAFEQEHGREVPSWLRRVLETNYFYDEIVSIERLEQSTPMFDLEVAEQHSFTVNGFVCHNSQGAEYPAVVLPLHTQHFKMLQRNLLYTAVTRGKRLVVVVGSRQALELAVRNHETARRYSMLGDRLRKAASEAGEPG